MDCRQGRTGPYAGPVDSWPDVEQAAIFADAFGVLPSTAAQVTRAEWDFNLAALAALARLQAQAVKRSDT